MKLQRPANLGDPGPAPGGGAEDREVLRRILEAIRSVRHGQVQIIIQDSRVVQIDTTEKVRLA
jgi:hypothetical protein